MDQFCITEEELEEFPENEQPQQPLQCNQLAGNHCNQKQLIQQLHQLVATCPVAPESLQLIQLNKGSWQLVQ